MQSFTPTWLRQGGLDLGLYLYLHKYIFHIGRQRNTDLETACYQEQKELLSYQGLVCSKLFQCRSLMGGHQLASDDVIVSGEIVLLSSIAVGAYGKG